MAATPIATINMAPPLPAVWGHRGASASYPENSLASFTQAIQDGAEGIESDVHVSKDDWVLCCHDPHLDRTTSGRGMICEQAYVGGMDQLHTLKLPQQPIPTFRQVIELLCQPGFEHAIFNIDVKVDNQPDRLFSLMHAIIADQPDYETKLAPRLVLGLWHPSFIEPAKRLMPYARLSHIGVSLPLARRYFFDHCSSFSMRFNTLLGRDGQQFIAECKAAGKSVVVWTVNKRNDMIAVTKLGVDVLISDHTDVAIKLRQDMKLDWIAVSKEVTASYSWSNLQYYTLYNMIMSAWAMFLLGRSPAGPIALAGKA